MSGKHAAAEYSTDIQLKPSLIGYCDSRTTREYLSNLNIDDAPPVVRGTGIICTIGPASQKVEMLEDLIANGMNVARLNFSHGSYEYHQQTIDNVRQAAKSSFPHAVGVALDTKGPEIRTGILKDGGDVTYVKGQSLRISCDLALRELCDQDNQYLDYPGLTKSVKVGSEILIADGNLILNVSEIIDEKNIMAKVMSTSTIGNTKNCCLPGAIIDLPAVSEKDHNDIQFAVKNKLDMIFASFIRKKEDIFEVRASLGEEGKYMKIVAKIENHQGIMNLDEIIAVSDGIMVARGDMGMEIPLEKVFTAQKMMIARCNAAGKPVICATEMLQSMIKNPRPTRAEITDVGNAVVDGADCVMLSGETASGAYPVESVSIMHKICREASACVFSRRHYDETKNMSELVEVDEATAVAAVGASFKINAAAIVVFTTSGSTAWLLSHYHPTCPIMMVARNGHVARIGHLYKNIFPLEYQEERKEKWSEDMDARLKFAIERGRAMGFIKTGSSIVFVCGWRPGSSGTNSMQILNIDEHGYKEKQKDITFTSAD